MKVFVFILALLGPFSATASVQDKVAEIWGHRVAYQLVILKDKSQSDDGKALVISRGKKQFNRVVVNTTYFEKEALEIWKTFESTRPPLFQYHPAPVLSVDQWHDLKKQLQYVAWHPVYLKAKAGHRNTRSARRDFVKTFREIRTRTIEYHELSHILDQNLMLGDLGRADFGSLSETRAFITELAYGENPLDSLWQGAAGALDEMRRGKNVDSSRLKMKMVLEATQTPLTLLSRSATKNLALLLHKGAGRKFFRRMTT